MIRTKWRRALSLLTVVAMSAAMLLGLAQPASAIDPAFYKTHTDWHFNLAKEPDRAMTQEEFIALTTSYSYWSTGVATGATPVDKEGKQPSAWAAPYIRAEYQKRTITPSQMDYDAPATLAFIMEFTARAKGLYSYNSVNVWDFKGTDGLSAEQELILSTAVDYGLFPYTKNMNVSVQVPRKDLEKKYLIPKAKPTLVRAAVAKSNKSEWSAAFYEDMYADYGKAQAEFDTLKAHSDDFNMIFLRTLYLQQTQIDLKKKVSGGYDKQYVADFITHDQFTEEGKTDPQVELIEYAKENNKKVLGCVEAIQDTSILSKFVSNGAINEAAIQQAVTEMMQIVDQYGLDGINLNVEVSGNAYRNVLNALATEMSKQLHAKDKMFVMTVGAYFKLEDEQKSIYNYASAGQLADLVMVITYDLHSAGYYNSDPEQHPDGEMSNLNNNGRCLRYAAAAIGADKVLMGLGSYGVCFNVDTKKANNMTFAEMTAAMQQYGAKPEVYQGADGLADGYRFRYWPNGQECRVYYESEAGIQRRLAQANCYGLIGTACFYLGSEYPAMFNAVGDRLNALPFADVAANSWYHDAVAYAYTNGLFNGITNTTFEPETSMSRAMLVTVLWRHDGEKEQGSNTFEDVRNDYWYTKAIAWASENGVVNGVGHGKFDPDGNITREQIAAILFRYSEKNGIDTSKRVSFDSFPDASKVSSYAQEAMQWAVAEELVKGSAKGGKTYLLPGDNATRAQVATIMERFIENLAKQNG